MQYGLRPVERGPETPMFPFDVILFDVGGVLLTNGWDHRERARGAGPISIWTMPSSRRGTRAHTTHGSATRSRAQEYLDATVFYEPREFHARRIFFEAIFAQSRAAAGWSLGNPRGTCRI